MVKTLLSKSPIREAIFDIKFNFDKKPLISDLEELHSEIKIDYPTKEVNVLGFVSFEFKPKDAPKLEGSKSINGYRFKSKDGSKVVQFRVDGFTFNHLRPYKDWDSFIGEAKKLLEIYKTKTKPSYPKRLALRYINAIEIPETTFDLDDYFLTTPHIGDKLPQGIVQFFSRIVIKDDVSDSVAIINQTVEEKSNTTKPTVIFDIDVFQTNERQIEEGLFWKKIEELKNLRTRIFEGSLTEKTTNMLK